MKNKLELRIRRKVQRQRFGNHTMTRDEAIRRALERTPSISCRQYVRDFRPELAGPIFGNRAAMTEAHRLTGAQVIEALGPWAQASVQAYRDADPSYLVDNPQPGGLPSAHGESDP